MVATLEGRHEGSGVGAAGGAVGLGIHPDPMAIGITGDDRVRLAQRQHQGDETGDDDQVPML